MNMLILKNNQNLLDGIGQRVVGAAVLGVSYRQTERGGLNSTPSGPVHEVDLDVVLRLSTGIVSVSWERDDLVEGLAVGWGDIADSEGVVSVPAANSEQWREIVGRTVTDVHVGWQVSEVDCPESMWSMRLSFGPAWHAVIALGELDRLDKPTYHPDNLLILFDEKTARSYRPLGATGSAWGSQSLLDL